MSTELTRVSAALQIAEQAIKQIRDLFPELKRNRVEQAVEIAEQAFWAQIKELYPEVKSGDLSPRQTIELTAAMEDAVAVWVDTNSK